MTVNRSYTKTVLVETLKEEIENQIPGILDSIIADDTTVTLHLKREPTTTEDSDLQTMVMSNLPSNQFVDEKSLTDQRNSDGFILYKKIFAHISTSGGVSSIDGFIALSDPLHKLRNFLKDGNFETAVRYFYKNVRPLNAFSDQELYRTWIKEISKKYNPSLTDAILDQIEQAPEGMV